MFKIHCWLIMAGVLAVFCGCGVAQDAPVTSEPGEALGEPMELSRGGLTLSVPARCDVRRKIGEDELLHVTEEDTVDGCTLSVALKAYAAAPETTAAAFNDEMVAFLDESLAFRNVEDAGRTEVEVAGLAGQTCSMTYTYRGQAVAAQATSFVRTVEDKDLTLCYLLMVEVPADQADQLDSLTESILATVALTDLSSTEAMTIESLGEPIEVHELGYAIAPPEAWFARLGGSGVEMGMMDYTQGVQVLPFAQALMADVDEGASAGEYQAIFLAGAISVAMQTGMKAEVLSVDDAMLGGHAGRQFVLRQTARPLPPEDAAESDAIFENAEAEIETSDADPLDRDDSTITIHRSIVVSATDDDDMDQCYSLVLICDGDDVEHGMAMMDELAKGFELIPIVEDVTDDEGTE